MRNVNTWNTKKLLLTLVILCFFIQMKAQNDQISIQSINDREFTVSSINGIPFTIVLENSNNDGQYQLGSNGRLTFKVEDLIGKRSTLRIVLQEKIFLSLEDKLVAQYQADVKWIESKLQITEGEFKIFPSRPIFTEAGLEKLKGKVFEYATSDKKEDYFNQWIEKVNYSYGAVGYFNEIFAASNGEDNAQRHNFLPINIYEELHK
ncbi:hypothetical protein [Aquimarina algiphila]|uniref:hypothetical protein n=1 Tax=Aquimarina algiphila TaxID=2047982 RepID=UPI00232DDB54|nr:hypothetical protein [Aquimarina algiphila]